MEEKLRYLEYISNQGIDFFASHWAFGGTFPISANQVQSFTNDPDQYVADYFSVNKELLNQWGNFRATLKCHGKTKKGYPCKNKANFCSRVDKPHLYNLNNSDLYCTQHFDQANDY